MTPLPLAFYRVAAAVLSPLAPVVLRRRARRGKEDPQRLPERLGRASLARPPGPLAWLHGASVGEGLSLLPLAEALGARRPDLHVLITTGTVTSARLLAERAPPGVQHQFAPVDTPGAARRFVAHWRPDLAVFAESEVWPNLLRAARRARARTALVSARLSRASVRGWGRRPASARAVFGPFDLVLAQDDATAAALLRLGARDDGRLNLKRAGAAPPVDAGALARTRAAFAGAPVVVAASTHSGEELIALDAFMALDRPEARLVIAPRHPERGREVLELARGRAGSIALRSAGFTPESTRVHVADTLGELGLWYALADAALVGGSLLPGPGGHNPLEPARLGCPFVSGPHVENWREVYADLGEDAVFTADAPALARAWGDMLNHPAAARARGERLRARALAVDGGLAAAADRLAALLPAPVNPGAS